MKTILVDAVYTFVIPDKGIDREMYKLLDIYPNRKIILTSANEEQMAKFGLNNLPYEVFSLKHHPEKTDPAYYTTMLNHFKLAAKDVIYFEHNESAAECARLVGINTYHYDQEKGDLPSLKRFIDQNIY